MKRRTVVWLLVGAFLRISHAEEKPTALEKSLWLMGGCLVFSGFDYWGYNASKNDHGVAPVGYRVCQLALQGVITEILHEVAGSDVAISFNIMWWTGVDEELYHFWGEVTNAYPTDGRGSWKRVREDGSTVRNWTPVGLLQHGYPSHARISGNTLLAQSIGGAGVSFVIILF